MKSALFLILLIMAWISTASTNPPSKVLKPGALATSIGQVVVVEDLMTIQLPLGDILHVAAHLKIIQTEMHNISLKLWAIQEYKDMSPKIKQIMKLQLLSAIHLNDTIQTIIPNLPVLTADVSRTAHAHRVKRGLFNFVGVLSKSLFGTATSADVDQMGHRMKLVTQAVTKQNRVIKQTYQGLITVNDQLNNLQNFTKEVSTRVNDLYHTIPSLTLVSLINEYLSSTHLYIDQVKENAKQMITDIVDAGLGKVTSKMLSLVNLQRAINIAQSSYNLSPLFSEELATYYFPILESTLTTTDILIHIPMKSSNEFQAWTLIPFPMVVKDSLVTVDMAQKLVIVSDDFTLIDVAGPRSLTDCKSTYLNLYVCPAWIFSFVTTRDAMCELALMKVNATQALQHCNYRPVEQKSVYHVHLHDHQYFYFPKDTSVSLICQNEPEEIPHTIANGFYVVPDYCEVRSDTLITLPTHHHFAFKVNLSDKIENLNPSKMIRLDDINLKTDQQDLIALMNTTKLNPLIETSLPIFLSQPVYVPYLIVNGCVLIFIIGFIICYICKISSRFQTLQEDMNQQIMNTLMKKSVYIRTNPNRDEEMVDRPINEESLV